MKKIFKIFMLFAIASTNSNFLFSQENVNILYFNNGNITSLSFTINSKDTDYNFLCGKKGRKNIMNSMVVQKDKNSSFSKLIPVKDEFRNEFPYSANVKLKVYIDGYEHNASGTLIAPNIVLTAGHVIYSKKHKWTDSVTVISAYATNTAITAKSYKFYVFRKYVEETEMKYDIALIILDKPLGDKAGFLGVGYKEDINYFLGKNIFYHLSYPSKSITGINEYNGSIQFESWGYFDKFIKKYDWVRYYHSAPKGESGSSFFAYENGCYVVYGVLSMSISAYVLITKQKFEVIKKIIEVNKIHKTE